MKITKTTVLSILAIGGVVAAGYFYMQSKKSETPTGASERGSEMEDEDVEVEDDGVFPLTEGSKGEEVIILQKYLNSSASCAAKEPPHNPNARMMAFLPLEEDGIFGRRTKYVLSTCYKTESLSKSTFNRMAKKLENAVKA